MTICRRKTDRAGAFSILEIVIALTVAALLAGVAVPAAGGWLSERRLREEAGRLQGAVEEARFDAMKSGTAQEVIIETPKESKRKVENLPPGIRRFAEQPPFHWTLKAPKSAPRRIRISSRGLVDPVEVRVASGDSWLAFRFDLLTGLPRDEQASF